MSRGSAARRPAEIPAIFPSRTERVVGFPLLGVPKYLVGLVQLLELLLRRRFVFGHVRMVLPSQFPEGLSDFIVTGVAIDAQNFVIISKFYRHRSIQGVAPANLPDPGKFSLGFPHILK